MCKFNEHQTHNTADMRNNITKIRKNSKKRMDENINFEKISMKGKLRVCGISVCKEFHVSPIPAHGGKFQFNHKYTDSSNTNNFHIALVLKYIRVLFLLLKIKCSSTTTSLLYTCIYEEIRLYT